LIRFIRYQHPFLIRGAEDRIIGDAATNERKALAGNDETAYRPIDYAKLTGEQLVKSSGKFVLLSKLLPKLYDGGHKVLIFSQMVRVLDLLQELLQLKHYRYERLDGSTSASSRNAAVDRFKRESFKRFVMLLSARAGGLGLNLTAADTVIIFDRSVLLR
jgi:SNF2 family DNA or RNA helicase